MDVTGVILAGGKSRRMGEDKRFLKVGESTLLERVHLAMAEVFKEVLVIIAQDSPPLEIQGAAVYRDLEPNYGSLGGLYTGLVLASHPRIFAVACDMPFLDPSLIRWFLNRDPQADLVLAELESGLQPLHGVYSKTVIPHMQRCIAARNLRIQLLVRESQLNVAVVSPTEWPESQTLLRSFHNLNSPEDLHAARTIVSQSAHRGHE